MLDERPGLDESQREYECEENPNRKPGSMEYDCMRTQMHMTAYDCTRHEVQSENSSLFLYNRTSRKTFVVRLNGYALVINKSDFNRTN